MRKSIVTTTLFALYALAVPAQAQNPGCKLCAAKSTVAACAQCVKENYSGQFTPAQMRSWCETNQPICMARAKKKD